MTEAPVKKGPGGRPTKYKPEYCQRIIEMADQGSGPAEYAVEFGIDRTTLYDWASAHEEFSTALSRAKIHEQAWWEKAGRGGMYLDKFNALVWKTSMQARFRNDYTERQQTELTGANGTPIQVESKSKIDVKALDPDQRETLKQLLLAAKEGKSK